jgi:transcriptional regulator with XRE-family HTH domain
VASDEPDTQRLADRVRARRAELNLTHEDIARNDGPSSPTLTKIENGQGPYSRLTLVKLDGALWWVAGSARDVLAGGDPVPLSPELVGPSPEDVERVMLDLPVEVTRGMSSMDREELITAMKLRAYEKAAEIRRRLDQD